MTYQLECKKDGLRQTQDGLWKLTLTVHPNDMPDEILKAPMGRKYIAVFADYDNDDPQPEYDGGETEPEQSKEKRKFEDMPRSQQAGMLCQESAFQEWLGVDGSDAAATQVRIHCGVKSRIELDSFACSAKPWDKLVADYRSQMGLRL